jgi:hypothetical protein
MQGNESIFLKRYNELTLAGTEQNSQLIAELSFRKKKAGSRCSGFYADDLMLRATTA